MTTPSEWAAEAMNKKGGKFVLNYNEMSVDAVLAEASSKNIGGGYTAYELRFEAPSAENIPSGDGIYTVKNDELGESELFMDFVQVTPSVDDWVAIVTCGGEG